MALALKLSEKKSALVFTWSSIILIYYLNDYGQFIRDVMSQKIAHGIVELDENQLGHARKGGRGSHSGDPIWIFGLTERQTNRL